MNANSEKNFEDKKEEVLKENEQQKKYKIIYSSYGYINILEDELNNNLTKIYKFTQYKKGINSKNILKGSIFRDNIKFFINIKIKYFYGKRQLVKFENVNILSKINTLIEKLFSNEDKKLFPKKYTKNFQYRLYSTKTTLRELNPFQTFFENNIHNNETLIFFREIPLFFSTQMKGGCIEISQMGKTAFKIEVDKPQYVLGNMGYTGGRHYFEIKLLTDPMIRSVVVGLCIKKDEKNLNSNQMKNFYGYILSDMKKVEIKFHDKMQEYLGDYGEMCSINDTVGVLYDCKEDGVNISFYKNKKNMGIAFNKLSKDDIYFPSVEMGLCGSKIQISNDLDFPEDI